MTEKFDILVRDLAKERVRARCAEARVEDFERLLRTLGVTLWRTDAALYLKSSFGMVIAESFADRFIGDFHREACGIDDASADLVAAHCDARAGERVTVAFEHSHRQYAILVEPDRDQHGTVVGTVALAVDLTVDD